MWILIFFQTFIFSEQIYINEVVSNNDRIIYDFQGECPDWIELYNPNNYEVDLYDYSLTDDKQDPIKWTFPDVSIKANSFLVIFCSGKDTIVGDEVHTNFNISSEGENLFLYDKNPIVIRRKRLDYIELPKLRENKAYGKLPDGNGKLSYLSTYSPGKTNIYSDEITCNYLSGFYKDSIEVELKSAMEYEIRYTLDGSDPTEISALYSNPIKLYHSSTKDNNFCDIITTPPKEFMDMFYHYKPQEKIEKMHILKYRAFSNNLSCSDIYFSQYYIADTNKISNIPIVSIVMDSLDLFGYEQGIYVPGIYFDTTNKGWSGNYYQLTENENKLSHFTYFNENFKFEYSQFVELSILGGGSRIYQQKSLKVEGKNYNGPDELEFNLYNSEKKKFKDIKLKSAYGVWSQTNIFQNELASEISINLDFEKLNYRPALMFLNGEFWGITTITEHRTKDYLTQFHNEDKDSVEIVMHHNTPPEFLDGLNYSKLVEFMENNSLAIQSNYDFISDYIDVSSFIDYYLFQIIIKNKDWPFANMNAWKSTNSESKWRWILYDLDGGFVNDLDYNMFLHLLQNEHYEWPNSKATTLTFRMFLKNESFKEKLKVRCKEILKKEFNFERTSELYYKVKSLYNPYIPMHFARWNYPFNYGEWWEDSSEEYIISFLRDRPEIVLKQLEDFMIISSNNLDDCYGNQCDDNGIVIYPNPNIGQFKIKSIDKYKSSYISVYSNVGKLEYSSNVIIGESHQFDFTFLPNGTYFIKFENKFGQYTFEKIVINR